MSVNERKKLLVPLDIQMFAEGDSEGGDENPKTYSEEEYNKMQSDRADAIQLMTMHSSKGLEFSEVHIINCVEGEIPHKKSRREYELEEERRMFYVAMTRAMDKLYIYSPRSMAEKNMKISRFINEAIEGE